MKTRKAVPQVDPPVFTPLDINGQRLSFNLSQVEFMPGYFAGRGKRGLKGQVKIDGVLFNVTARSCGLDCYCDAIITPVETKAVPQTAHTPGPWRLLERHSLSDSDSCVYATDNRGNETFGASIAAIDPDVQLANARLIAAAPEMLAALEAIATYWNSNPASPGSLSPYAHLMEEDEPIMRVVNVAIAKAIGGAK